MSAGSADTALERGLATTALIAASAMMPTSTPWSRPHKSWSVKVNNNSITHGGRTDNRWSTNPPAGDDKTTTDGGETTLNDDDLVGVVDQLLCSGGRWRQEVEDGLDLCSSNWKSVETMARALAAGQSVTSTISVCYSLTGRTSDPRDATAAVRRTALQTGTEVMHASLLSGRLAAKALAVFRRLGQAPLTQPDSLFINSSKLPEAAKTLDPGLDDATITAWMKANGFEQKGRHSESFEALPWTEYCQALSELSPAFRRHGIKQQTLNKRMTASTTSTTPAATYSLRGGGRLGVGEPFCPNHPSLADERYHDPWDDVLNKTSSLTSPLYPCRSGFEGGENRHLRGRLRDGPPRSPGPNSYGVLRRKRHAAVSLDYEAITRQPPQVMPPLDPSILVDHIKAQGRRERKKLGSDGGGGSSLWALDTHQRLSKMSLQKEQVSETANPRLVQPRQVAVQLRSRRSEFGRRREADAELMARLARNAGVICRQAKLAEALHRERDRLSAGRERVESQRVEETRRLALVRAGAIHRARERRIKMEMLKSCVADQLQTIEKNECRAIARVRDKKHVLLKGEGKNKIEAMQRARSSPALGRSQTAENAHEPPCLKPTVPPPDEDTRWIYSPRSRSQQRQATPAEGKRVPTPNLDNAVLAADTKGPDEQAYYEGVERECGTDGIEVSALAVAGPSAAERNNAGIRASTRQPPSRKTRGREPIMRWCSSTGEARKKTRHVMWQKRLHFGGAGKRGVRFDDLPLKAEYHPTSRAKHRPMRAGFGFHSGEDAGAHSASCLSASSPALSPWGRQIASPAEYCSHGGGTLNAYNCGVVGWTEDASGSNVE